MLLRTCACRNAVVNATAGARNNVLRRAAGPKVANRALVISHSAGLAGAERSLLTCSEYLKAAGWQLIVVCPRRGPLVGKLTSIGVAVRIIHFPWWTTTDAGVCRNINRAASRIARLARDSESQVIYSNTSVVNVGAVAAMIAGIPHVWHIREFLSRSCFLGKLQRDFVKAASNRVLFNSRAVQIDTTGPAGWGHSAVLYNYVSSPTKSCRRVEHDPELRAFLRLLDADDVREAPKLLVLGAVQPYKRPADAIKALDLLKSRKPHGAVDSHCACYFMPNRNNRASYSSLPCAHSAALSRKTASRFMIGSFCQLVSPSRQSISAAARRWSIGLGSRLRIMRHSSVPQTSYSH
ncbi:hypothetical protein CKO31_14245 [Thiohalocapsa halophila]|uniref:Glycosyltransferase subfamily 4-like N-terminal domain-containing protein n=1 Tax=Thiohalocapsa halophila TaxID=69359 RepID=A0ABS1CJ36_9GAMM|nr:hypothetical protein [Thiohalocapsa halophila]